MKKVSFLVILVLFCTRITFCQVDSVQVSVNAIDYDTNLPIEDFKIVVHSVDGKEKKYFNTYLSHQFKIPYGDEYWISIEKEDYFECRTYITLTENLLSEMTMSFILVNRYRPQKD